MNEHEVMPSDMPAEEIEPTAAKRRMGMARVIKHTEDLGPLVLDVPTPNNSIEDLKDWINTTAADGDYELIRSFGRLRKRTVTQTVVEVIE